MDDLDRKILDIVLMTRLSDQFPRIKRFSTNVVMERVKSGLTIPVDGQAEVYSRTGASVCKHFEIVPRCRGAGAHPFLLCVKRSYDFYGRAYDHCNRSRRSE